MFNTTETDISSKGAGFWSFGSEELFFGKFYEKLKSNKFPKYKPFNQKCLKVWGKNKAEHLFLVRNILKVEQSAHVTRNCR